MYREMRRRDRAITDEKAREILEHGEYGMLSTVGGDGQPYGVPLSYIVRDNDIYFHCANTGQKVDNMAHESRVSFAVVGHTQPVYENNFTTLFESTVVFGTASKVEEETEKTEALMLLAKKYLPDHIAQAPADIAKAIDITAVYRIHIEHLTGKAKRAKPV